METLHRRRIEAIIAFYNLFCEKMVLEECKDLLKTRYLLHSVVEFIDKGSLEYQTHENFGFHATVDFLKDHLDASITDCLDADLAETENRLEIAKILVALLYAFRLELTEEIVSYVNELPPRLNSEIATIIQYLDDEEVRDSNSDILAHILTVKRAASGDLSSTTNDSSVLSNSSPRSPLIDICNNSLRLSSMKNSTPQTAISKPRELFGIDAGSPITAVLNSPRGANVTRIKQQQRNIVELKEQLETLKRQYDLLEEECSGLRDKLADAEKDTEILQKKNKRSEAELRRQFEEAVAHEKAENTKLRAAVKKGDVEIERLNACQLELRFQKDSALNEAKNFEEVNKTLSDSLDETRRRLQDDTEMLSFMREKQAEAQNKLCNWEVKFHKLCESHRREIEVQQLRTENLIAQKDDEFQKHLQTTLLVQANYKSRVDQLEAQLHELTAENSTLSGENKMLLNSISAKDVCINNLNEDVVTENRAEVDKEEAKRIRELELRNERNPPHLREHYFFETSNMSTQKGFSPSAKRVKKKTASHSIGDCFLTPIRAMRRKHAVVEESPPS